MSIMLPSALATVLNMCGVMWPNIDEDKLSSCAVTDRKLAQQVDAVRTHTDAATTIILTSNKGKTATAFGAHGQKVSVHLGNLRRVYEVTADALDLIAAVVKAAKIAIIAQLVIAVGELVAGAFTFGLLDALSLAAEKITLQGILDWMEGMIAKFAQMIVIGGAVTALLASAASLAGQATSDYVGTGDGINLGSAAEAGAAAV